MLAGRKIFFRWPHAIHKKRHARGPHLARGPQFADP